MTPEITSRGLAEELASDKPPTVLDVREPFELEICRLPNILPIPIGEVVARLSELDPRSEIVVVCRSGARSAQVTDFLLEHGFSHVRNLAGGMNGWARDIDPSMPTY